MKQIKNIKYTFYCGGMGPQQGGAIGYTPAQSNFSSVKEFVQYLHPDYYNIQIIDYDVVDD